MISEITNLSLFLSESIELSILAKATLILLLGLIATWLASRRRASLRHLLLTSTFGMLLALPLVVGAAPGIAFEVPLAATVAVDPESGLNGVVRDAQTASPRLEPQRSVSPISSWSLPSWPRLLLMAWMAGAAVLLLSLMTALWRLRRIRRDGLPWPEINNLTRSIALECNVHRPVEILLHEDVPAPLTCGIRRPAVILPVEARNWGEVELRRALVHEFEHVRRQDWIVQLATRVTCISYWFHPLVWVAWRRLCLEAERACDDAVVQTSERSDYAEQLVTLAQQMANAHAQPAIGMAKRSDLSARVSAILDIAQKRGRVGLSTAAVAVCAAGILLLLIAPVRAVPRVVQATNVGNQQSVANQSPANPDSPRRRPSATDRALYEAAAEGDTSSIDELLKAGANVNCVIDGDGSPLIGAARNGHLETVRLLLDRGADPNMPVSGDGSPLIVAANEGQLKVATLLLDRGANVDQIVPGDESALIQASGEGHLEMVKLLVNRGANINLGVAVEGNRYSKSEYRSPLSMARKGSHEDVVAFLLSMGAREEQ